MRNFGATAPPLAPEPTSKCGDRNIDEPRNSTTGRDRDKESAESSQWPDGESSCTDDSLDGKDIKGAQNPPGFGDNNMQSPDVTAGTERLAQELEAFVSKGSTGDASAEQEDSSPLSDDAIADLQLQTARKLRQLLPTNRELLNLVHEKNWIPLLLEWLTLNDRPEVQVEALLALTSIAELCANHSFYQHAHGQSSAAVAAAAAAQAAAAAVKASGTNLSASASMSPFYSYPPSPPPSSGEDSSGAPGLEPSTYPYPSLSPQQGKVTFPPLSFSQKMTPEALAALDATLSNTIQHAKSGASLPNSGTQTKGSSSASPASPLSALTSTFPPSSLSSPPVSSAPISSLLSSTSAPGGSPFLPPPTPVPSFGGSSSFPPQLSASSQHMLLRHDDAIPTLISLLSSPNREVYEQAMWILGGIAAGDSSGSSTGSSGSSGGGGRDKSVAARDVILEQGIMNPLLRCLEAHPQNLALQRIGSWTLSNLVEGLFQQSSRSKSGGRNSDYSGGEDIDIETLLPVLRRLLHMADAEVLSYTCWTLSHFCDGPSSHIAVVTTGQGKGASGGLVPRLVELLIHPSWRVTKPALRTIGNIVCAECSEDSKSSSSGGPTDYTEIILDCGAVPRLKELVTHNNREIQKEACWTLSNIAAGTVDQIQAVIDSGAIPPLVKLVGNKITDQEVRSEACWVVLNATSCGSDPQIKVLVDEGCVSVLAVLLDEASMVMMALEGLERVLQVEETRETVRREKLENGEIADDDDSANHSPSLVSASLIEKALEKPNGSAVTKRANRIWKQHFVSCALCKKSFSKHRTSDATFCNECKCYVCSACDCKMYHLSYQEELWAVNEEQTEAKKSAKKSKKQKKKEKQKLRKAKQQVQHQAPDMHGPKEVKVPRSRSSTVTSASDSGSVGVPNASPQHAKSTPLNEVSLEASASDSTESGSTPAAVNKGGSSAPDGKKSGSNTACKVSKENRDDVEGSALKRSTADEGDKGQQPPVDFVLYLQETGSIIALAKLMDALDYGDEHIDESSASVRSSGDHVERERHIRRGTPVG